MNNDPQGRTFQAEGAAKAQSSEVEDENSKEAVTLKHSE